MKKKWQIFCKGDILNEKKNEEKKIYKKIVVVLYVSHL